MAFETYLSFLETAFQGLVAKYGLAFETPRNEHEAVLGNANVKIRCFTFAREEGIGIVLINPKDNAFYHIPDVLKQKGIDGGAEYEQMEAASLLDKDDEVKAAIAYAAICLEKYCTDILSGDFSVMG